MTKTIRVVQNSTRLRKEPSTAAPILGQLPRNMTFDVSETTPPDTENFEWYKVAAYLREDVVQVLPEPDFENPGKILYKSQWDDDANSRGADCGQTCVAMVATKYGVQVRVNDLRFQTTSTGLTTGQNLVDNFASIGIKAEWKYYTDFDTFSNLNLKSGDICLVKYSGFNRASVQDDNYQGWHWVVYLSSEWDNALLQSVVVHDPDFWGSRRNEGDSKIYSATEWNKAFIKSNSLGRIIVRVIEN